MIKSNLKNVLEVVCRQCVFIIISIYAISKILGGQFYLAGDLPDQVAETRLGEVSSFTLAWTFMGHSFFYMLFVGLSQLIGAWMLLWNRTKLFGVMILIPIMVNIILFDIIFLDVYPALVNAIVCLSMLLLILYFNNGKIVEIFEILTNFPTKSKVPLERRVYTIGITILTIALIFAFDTLIENWLGASKEKIIE